MFEDNGFEQSSWRKKVSGTKERLQRILSDEIFLGERAGEYGRADLVLGLPDGEVMDKVMDRIKKRAAEETDIVENMEKAGIDIFSKLDVKKTGKDVDFLVVDKAPKGKEDSSGWADRMRREIVVVAPEGFDRRRYLEWAITGSVKDVDAFHTAYHETVHSAEFPDISGEKVLEVTNAKRLAIFSGAIFALSLLFESDLETAHKIVGALGLAHIGIWGLVGKFEPEKGWKDKKSVSHFYGTSISEMAARMSAEDLGFISPVSYERVEDILVNELSYLKHWQAMVNRVKAEKGKEIKVGLRELRERTLEIGSNDRVRVVQTGQEIMNELLARQRYEVTTVDVLKDIFDKVETRGSKVKINGYDFDNLNKYKFWKYINYGLMDSEQNIDPKVLAEMESSAVDELVRNDVAMAMRRVFKVFRAADAVGLTKYELWYEVHQRIWEGKIQKPKSINDWALSLGQVIAERAAEKGLGKVNLDNLADEAETKIENRHNLLRVIVLEELENVWDKEEIDLSGKTLSWEKRALYVGKDINNRWGVEINGKDEPEGAGGIRLLKFDKKMKIENVWQKISDYDDLEIIVSEVLEGLDENGWKVLEQGLTNSAFPSETGKLDVSNGQLQILLLTKAVEMIPERWGMPEVKETYLWQEFRRELVDELRLVKHS